MIRRLILVAALGLSTSAFAKNTVSGLFSMGAGGFSLGGSFEHEYDKGAEFGGYARFFQKDDDEPSNTHNGYFLFGGNVRVHADIRRWDFSIAPGLGIMNIDKVGGGDDITTISPSLGLALMYNLNNNMSVGVENYRYYAWLDEDVRGLVIDDIAVKFSGSF